MKFKVGDKVRLIRKCSHSCNICRKFYNEVMEVACLEYGVIAMTNLEIFENFQLELVADEMDYVSGF